MMSMMPMMSPPMMSPPMMSPPMMSPPMMSPPRPPRSSPPRPPIPSPPRPSIPPTHPSIHNLTKHVLENSVKKSSTSYAVIIFLVISLGAALIALVLSGVITAGFIFGDLDIGGDLKARKDLEVDGYIQVDGDLKANKDLEVDGDLKANKDLEVDGDLKANKGLEVDGIFQANGIIRLGSKILQTGGVGTIPNGTSPLISASLMLDNSLLNYENGSSVNAASFDTGNNIENNLIGKGITLSNGIFFDVIIHNSDNHNFIFTDTIPSGITLKSYSNTDIPAAPDNTDTSSYSTNMYRFYRTGKNNYILYVLSKPSYTSPQIEIEGTEETDMDFGLFD